MSVPNVLQNSTATTKFVVDAIELNQNFDSLSDGTGIDDGAIVPRHIFQGATNFVFPETIQLNGLTNNPADLKAGMLWFRSDLGSWLGYNGSSVTVVA